MSEESEEPHNRLPLQGGRFPRGDEALWECRLRWHVTTNVLRDVFAGILTGVISVDSITDYSASNVVHMRAPAAMPGEIVCESVWAAFWNATHALWSYATKLLRVEAFRIYPTPQVTAVYSALPEFQGTGFGEPIPALACVLWELVQPRAAKRRRGYLRIPGLDISQVVMGNGVLTSDGLITHGLAADALQRFLAGAGLTWCIANYPRDNDYSWAVQGVGVLSQLRPYRRRWPVADLPPVWSAGLYLGPGPRE